MVRFQGNTHTKEVHDTLNEKPQCQLAKIKPEHRKLLADLASAHAQGFDNCHWCIGDSKR